MLPLFVQKLHGRLKRKLWGSPFSAIPAPFRASSKRDKTIAARIADYEKSAGVARRVAGAADPPAHRGIIAGDADRLGGDGLR
jgi:hypothetical protein